MSIIYRKLLPVVILVVVTTLQAQNAYEKADNFPLMKGPYFGQKPPGMSPEPFVPNLLPEKYWWHSSPAFSPDGKEVYFSAFIRNKAYSERIMYS